MDNDRFDWLAAALADAPSRRGLLRLFSGGSLLAMFGQLDSDEAAARKKGKKKCRGNKKKCGKRCIPKANCCTARNCPNGEVCRNGLCSNCVSSDDCLGSSCQQAACENGRCVFQNLSGGFTVCGIGACERTVERCLDGVEQPCVPGQPSPETCNGIDDDCDGEIDEDFDFDTDPSHCGSCNAACQVDPPASCGESGLCAGGNCQKYGTATVCQPASCVGTTRQPAARCDGNGSCAVPQTVSCEPFVCHSNGTGCIGSCGGDVDCIAGHYCGGGQCRPKEDNGEECIFNSHCQSNFCDNGICRPKRANGETCSDGLQCESGICVANVCCATLCNVSQSCVGGTCQG